MSLWTRIRFAVADVIEKASIALEELADAVRGGFR
jgi:hypothetical protein